MSNINITFFCFQPIDIKTAPTQYLENTTFIDQKSKGAPINWINDFDQFNDSFKHKKTIKLDTSAFKTYHQSTNLLTPEFDQYIREVDAYLIITPHFSHVMLTFEVHLNISLSSLENKHKNTNLYQQIRHMLVEDSDQASTIRPWAKTIRLEAIQQTKEIFQGSKQTSKLKPCISISPNSGNISCIADSHHLSPTDHHQLTKLLLDINKQAERLRGKIKSINIQGGLISFNGRFHTLVIQNEDDKNRYTPILYHMQFIWSQLRKLNSSLEMISRQISSGLIKDHKHNINIANKLVNHCAYLKQIHESFKLSLERDNEEIYCKIQGNWNIENMLINVCSYSGNLDRYIGKTYQRQSSRQQTRQNNSLLFIGILQIIALISVWADYIQINTQPTINSTHYFLLSWRRLDELSIIELIHISLFPIGLITVILLMLHFRSPED